MFEQADLRRHDRVPAEPIPEAAPGPVRLVFPDDGDAAPEDAPAAEDEADALPEELVEAGLEYIYDTARTPYQRPRTLWGMENWYRVLGSKQVQECDLIAGTLPTEGAAAIEKETQMLARGLVSIGGRPFEPTGPSDEAVEARVAKIREWPARLRQANQAHLLDVTAEFYRLITTGSIKNS